MAERLIAAVQYDDFKGSVAADMIDTPGATLADRALAQGLYDPKYEMVVGFRLWMGEKVGSQKLQAPDISVLIATAPSVDAYKQRVREGAPPQLKAAALELTLEELFSCYKRFAITLTNKDLNLADANIQIDS